MKTGQGFILVYSVTSRQSFEFTQKLRVNILRMKEEAKDVGYFLIFFGITWFQFPIVLVGNKKDLESERQVPENDGKLLAEKFEIPFIETSAKTNDNVYEAFFILVRQINKYREKHPEIKKKKKHCNII